MTHDLNSQIHKSFQSVEITDKEFEQFTRLIYQLTGIHMTEKKRQLVVSRLGKRLKFYGMSSFSQYYDLLTSETGQLAEIPEFINQITTNKTDFFREAHHFEFIRSTMIPDLVSRGVTNIRFWSAGCSTGEEPYTLAITLSQVLEELKASSRVDLKILATDLDTNVLRHTLGGVYQESKLGPISQDLRKKYFAKTPEGSYAVNARLRQILTVRRLNLIAPFPFKKGFNGIFCRNVLIYFQQDDRKQIVARMREHLRPGGILFLGHSESLLADTRGFKNLGNTIYQRVD